ncbi:hypothetical protein [Shimia isoporae]|uniref:hypothetical protein n=1 Tax=Shimia isoporae TaxID=647720 RepID=UPI001048E1E2|nr:hypothetical protein [Shimia isoporae]
MAVSTIAVVLAALLCFILVAVVSLNVRLSPDLTLIGKELKDAEAVLGPSQPGTMDEYVWGAGFPTDALPLVVKGISGYVAPEKVNGDWEAPIVSVEPFWILGGFLTLNRSYEPGYAKGIFCFWSDDAKRCDFWL